MWTAANFIVEGRRRPRRCSKVSTGKNIFSSFFQTIPCNQHTHYLIELIKQCCFSMSNVKKATSFWWKPNDDFALFSSGQVDKLALVFLFRCVWFLCGSLSIKIYVLSCSNKMQRLLNMLSKNATTSKPNSKEMPLTLTFCFSFEYTGLNISWLLKKLNHLTTCGEFFFASPLFIEFIQLLLPAHGNQHKINHSNQIKTIHNNDI